jgi:hypothetical protein
MIQTKLQEVFAEYYIRTVLNASNGGMNALLAV